MERSAPLCWSAPLHYSGDTIPPYKGDMLPPYRGDIFPPYKGEMIPLYTGDIIPHYRGDAIPSYAYAQRRTQKMVYNVRFLGRVLSFCF